MGECSRLVHFPFLLGRTFGVEGFFALFQASVFFSFMSVCLTSLTNLNIYTFFKLKILF